MHRRTKIVCTLGPGTRSPEAVGSLVDAGMDVARLNFSHGRAGEHAEAYQLVREAAEARGRPVGSSETSVGQLAVTAVATMARIAATAEKGNLAWAEESADHSTPVGGYEAVTAAAPALGRATHAGALAVFTRTGRTARCLARHRSPIPVMAFTAEQVVRRQLSLSWGVEAFMAPADLDAGGMVEHVDRTVLDLGRASIGSRVVIIAHSGGDGDPSERGGANMFHVHELGSR